MTGKHRSISFQKIKHIDSWALAVLSGLSVFYVLFVFKGFNIQGGESLSGHSLFVRAVVFGIATTLLFGLCEWLAIRFYPIDSLKKRIAFYAIEVVLGIQITFLLFNYFWVGTEWTLSAYTYFLYEYPSMVIFSIIISGLIYWFQKNRKPNDDLIRFYAENGKEFINVNQAEFLYLKSSGNYVEIFYLSNGTPNKALIRNSLKAIEQTHENHPSIVRSHRSYLVNPAHIKSVMRKKGKLELDLGHATIPVSEKYEKQFS